jgi:hypothetical protein
VSAPVPTSIAGPPLHELETLERTWRRPPGPWGFLTDVDHKVIGRRFVVTALVLFAGAGVLALLMRLQLARPDTRPSWSCSRCRR